MTEQFISSLQEEDVCQEKFSLGEILEDSLFYPACYSDGDPIKYCNSEAQELGIRSFIYCDYGPWFEDPGVFNEMVSRVRGYKLFSMCKISLSKIFPAAWKPFYRRRYFEEGQRNFCRWIIYERLPSFPKEHGPKRFSVLYIGAEGLSTYIALYERHGVCPKALSVINPGMDRIVEFDDPNNPLFQIIFSHGSVAPHLILRTGFDEALPGYYRNKPYWTRKFSAYKSHLHYGLHYDKRSDIELFGELQYYHTLMRSPFWETESTAITNEELDILRRFENKGNRITSSVIQELLNVTYDQAQIIIRAYIRNLL